MTTIKKTAPFITSLSCIMAITGCLNQPGADRRITTVKHTGYYNTIGGTLSDGTPIKGVGWFHMNAKTGEFCATAGQAVCSGRHSAEGETYISGSFACSDGKTGTYQTNRITQGNFLEPVDGAVTVSDGRTGTLSFGPMTRGSGETTCWR